MSHQGSDMKWYHISRPVQWASVVTCVTAGLHFSHIGAWLIKAIVVAFSFLIGGNFVSMDALADDEQCEWSYDVDLDGIGDGVYMEECGTTCDQQLPVCALHIGETDNCLYEPNGVCMLIRSGSLIGEEAFEQCDGMGSGDNLLMEEEITGPCVLSGSIAACDQDNDGILSKNEYLQGNQQDSDDDGRGDACAGYTCDSSSLPANASGCNSLIPELDQAPYQYVASCNDTPCSYECMNGYVYSGAAGGCIEEPIEVMLCGTKHMMELSTLSTQSDGLCVSGATVVSESFIYSGSTHQRTWHCMNEQQEMEACVATAQTPYCDNGYIDIGENCHETGTTGCSGDQVCNEMTCKCEDKPDCDDPENAELTACQDPDGDGMPNQDDPNDDGDGLDDVIEAGQDGNKDGIDDSVQGNVATIDRTAGGKMTLDVSSTSSCDRVVEFVATAEDSELNDTAYDYQYGLNRFAIACDTGATATIRVYYPGVSNLSSLTYRKSLSGEFSTFSGVTYGVFSGVPFAEFMVTDGSAQDEDGVANGMIIDDNGPGYESYDCGTGYAYMTGHGCQAIQPSCGDIGLTLSPTSNEVATSTLVSVPSVPSRISISRSSIGWAAIVSGYTTPSLAAVDLTQAGGPVMQSTWPQMINAGITGFVPRNEFMTPGAYTYILELQNNHAGAMFTTTPVTCMVTFDATCSGGDSDDDQVCDSFDNCLGLANPDQADFDGDSIGDLCDDDQDGDGENELPRGGGDACPSDPNKTMPGSCGCGIPDSQPGCAAPACGSITSHSTGLVGTDIVYTCTGANHDGFEFHVYDTSTTPYSMIYADMSADQTGVFSYLPTVSGSIMTTCIPQIGGSQYMSGACTGDETILSCPVAGISCDDGDPLTTNDMTDGMCGCVGYQPGPDCNDIFGGNQYPGSACDDGLWYTIDDKYDEQCSCLGMYDCDPTLVGNQQPGESCDDGDSATENDQYDAMCNCVAGPDEQPPANPYCDGMSLPGATLLVCNGVGATQEAQPFIELATCGATPTGCTYCLDADDNGECGDQGGTTGALVCDPMSLPSAIHLVCSAVGATQTGQAYNEVSDCTSPPGGCTYCLDADNNGFCGDQSPPDTGGSTGPGSSSGGGGGGSTRTIKCGDGIKQPKEQCDDGNMKDGDGCDRFCRIEDDDDDDDEDPKEGDQPGEHGAPRDGRSPTPKKGDFVTVLDEAIDIFQDACKYDLVDYNKIMFKDLRLSPDPEQRAAATLLAHCIVKGYDRTRNQKFHLDAFTSKAEALKILSKVAAMGDDVNFDEGKRIVGPMPYKDMQPDHWYLIYALYAYKEGMLRDVGTAGNLKAFTPLTQAELRTILQNMGVTPDEYYQSFDHNKYVKRGEMARIVVEAFPSKFQKFEFFYGNNLTIYNVLLRRIEGKSDTTQRKTIERLVKNLKKVNPDVLWSTFKLHVDGMIDFLESLLDE